MDEFSPNGGGTLILEGSPITQNNDSRETALRNYLLSDHHGKQLTKKIQLSTLRDIEDVAEHNTMSRPEDPIFDIVRNTDRERPPVFPSSPGEISGPLDYIRGRLDMTPGTDRTNAPLLGFQTPKSTSEKEIKKGTKKTAIQHVENIIKKLFKNHGRKNSFSPKNETLIEWDFTADGSKKCTPFYLPRRTSEGYSETDVSVCPECYDLRKYRSYCDNLRCSQKYCAEQSATERAFSVSDRFEMITQHTEPGAVSGFHIFVSPPPELSPYWIQYGPYFDQLNNIIADIMHGIGFQGFTSVWHTHRGRKKDPDLKDAKKWLSIDGGSDGEDNPYFWRLGPHAHIFAFMFNSRTMQYFKALCREIYNKTGFIVHIKPVKTDSDDIARVIKYQLSHAGIGYKMTSGRALPVIRSYGMLAPNSKGVLKKVDLGTVIAVRPCSCSSCKGSPLETLKHTPSTVHRKLFGYIPKVPQGVPDYPGDMVHAITDNLPTVPYWDPSGRPIVQKIIPASSLKRLLSLDDLFIPERHVPRYVLDRDPEEPEIDPGEISVPYWVTDDYPSDDLPGDIPPTESSSPPPKRPPAVPSWGQLYDVYELMQYVQVGDAVASAPGRARSPYGGCPQAEGPSDVGEGSSENGSGPGSAVPSNIGLGEAVP